jgi:hypothetical protein
MELLGLWYEKGCILIFVEKQLDADDLFKDFSTLDTNVSCSIAEWTKLIES